MEYREYCRLILSQDYEVSLPYVDAGIPIHDRRSGSCIRPGGRKTILESSTVNDPDSLPVFDGLGFRGRHTLHAESRSRKPRRSVPLLFSLSPVTVTKHMGYIGKVGFLYFGLCCIVWSTLYFMLPGLSSRFDLCFRPAFNLSFCYLILWMFRRDERPFVQRHRSPLRPWHCSTPLQAICTRASSRNGC